MSGVMLRCPNCGTANTTGGECDACHEADVRYFCTNHTPGVWLDSAQCAQCGARFGDPAPAPKLAPPPVTRTATSVPRVTKSRSEPRGRDRDMGPWGTTDRDSVPGDRGFDAGGRGARPDATAILSEMIRAARARRPRADRYEYEEDAPRPRRGGGCLGRLVMLALLLFGLFLLIPIFLGTLFGFL